MKKELYFNRGYVFAVYENDNCFIVVVDRENYILNSISDVKEFIQYYGI